MEYRKATELLLNGHPQDCIEFFKTNNNSLEYAYALLLTSRIKESKYVVEQQDSVRSDWLKKLLLVLEGEIVYPTYFQIRNFLEIDLTMFIKSGRVDYVNILLKQAENFQGINNETYKLLGRCLLKNGYPKECKIFLDRSLKEYYNDVELHYLFAEYYLYMNDLNNAKKAVENCLRINSEYYPAKKSYKLLSKK